MDDATNEIYSAFLIDEEGTNSSFRGVKETIDKKGLFSTIYVDRGSHYAHTPNCGGKVDKNNPTQFGRALQQLGIQIIHAYSPQARGRSERMFRTLQSRLPQELRSNNITTIKEANNYINKFFLAKFNKLFTKPPKDKETAFIPYVGVDIKHILCIQEDRVVNNDNTVSYKNMKLQIPKSKHRYHYVKAKVKVHVYEDNSICIFHGPRMLAQYTSKGEIYKEEQKKKIAA